MIMCEQDSDVLRWGLHHLLGDMSISEFCGTATQSDVTCYDREYAQETNIGTVHTVLENDEDNAYSLQEALSQVAVAEASDRSHDREDYSQTSVLVQDWFRPTETNLWSGIKIRSRDIHGELDDVEASSSCPSPTEKSNEEELFQLEIVDDNASLDGEVGKRLNHVVPVPHVPKINGGIPSVDEATSDHQRLLDRLQLYDLVERKVQGDGNCQFRALSDQFYRTPDHHKFVRQQVVNQLKSHPELYDGYVPMAYGDYLKKMSKSGEWGDHVTLQAAADKYGVKIFVITSFKDTCYIEILPKVQKCERVIHLSFWAEVHYNSIYPEGGLDMPTKRRKRDILAEASTNCSVM
ncbi:uncharacterized protein M6B38_300505 [Iris pallida]|uniref:ubiquitinyl hydrolase 1 n=1 Tax=Iris pallida TaxID=29817 RepID=A0AAX6HQQ3_IRIPA|nr:uncharacterized protein M6B38_353165 [Iris pallida]KAJ6843162.1 uncharacterized protein M6B38_300505 [Iris pallida]